MYHCTTMLRLLFILGCVVQLIFGIPLAEHENEFSNDVDFAFENLDRTYRNVPTPVERVQKLGYMAETHEAVTQDGYILQMHRITGSKKSPRSDNKPVVLLIHGLLDCSVTWVMASPEKSLGYILADKGYDVWMGNVRGNRYSRGHVTLPTADKDYWLFSWHEIGVYDIPAMIDYILIETKQEKIFYVGHSQGGTSFFVMASERPEYQEKIAAVWTLAPAVFMSRASNPLFRLLAPFVDNLKKLAELIGMHEFKPSGAFLHKLSQIVCQDQVPTQPLCTNIITLFGGRNNKDLNLTLIPDIGQYDPAGSSTRQFIHYGQLINSGNFEQFDHGLIGNLKTYGKIRPPKYNLANVKIPVHLHYSNNDEMVNVKDLQILHESLPNVKKFLVPYKWFAHLDFVWGQHAENLLYPKILNLMATYKI